MENKDLLNEELIDVEDDFSEDELDEQKVRLGDFKENVLEWLNGQDIITVTLAQRRLINKVTILAKKYPDEVRIDRVNDDGTILAHIPLSYLKLQRPREMSEEDKEKAKERLKQYWKPKK